MIRNNKGMTLIELVIAIILLMMIITAFSMVFTQALLWTGKSNKDTTNIATARKYMDNNLSGLLTLSDYDPLLSTGALVSRPGKVEIKYANESGTETKTPLHITVTVNGETADPDAQNRSEAREIKYHLFR